MTVTPPQPDAATDADLIADYVSTGSDDAFRRLVQRHLRLVYGAARRQIFDPQSADDVTQAVFILLARKAGSISNPGLLSAWLMAATHYACCDVRKAANRRRVHERKAAEMKPSSRGNEPEDETIRLLPLLDGAMCQLRESDRAVVTLRFLEGRSMGEVGTAAGISESAAAKRIERALSKLRGILGRRGARVPLVGLTVALMAAGEASAGDVSRVTAATMSGTALAAARGLLPGASASVSIAKGAGQIMAIAKAKTVAVVLSAVVVLGGGGAAIVHYVFGQSAGVRIVSDPVVAAGPIEPPAIPAPPVAPIEKNVAPPTVNPPSPAPKDLPASMASVSGRVKFEGPIPEMMKIAMDGVVQCSMQHREVVYLETAVIGKDRGLANVVVSIKREEGRDLPGGMASDPAVLDQVGCQYKPHVVAVMVGQPIVVKNGDAWLHNIHTLPEKNEAQNMAMPTINPGTKLKTPKEVEYFRVKCDVHPWMNAWVAVLDNPYFAISDAEGKFALPKGLPDGDYTLHAWHEKFGEQDSALTVKDGCATAEFIFRPR